MNQTPEVTMTFVCQECQREETFTRSSKHRVKADAYVDFGWRWVGKLPKCKDCVRQWQKENMPPDFVPEVPKHRVRKSPQEHLVTSTFTCCFCNSSITVNSPTNNKLKKKMLTKKKWLKSNEDWLCRACQSSFIQEARSKGTKPHWGIVFEQIRLINSFK